MKVNVYEFLKMIKENRQPRIIKYKGSIYEYTTNIFGTGYLKKDCKNTWFCNEVFVDDIEFLNDEVEIIEDDKKIEKIDFKTLNTQKEKNRVMKDTINEIIDKLNKMEENK